MGNYVKSGLQSSFVQRSEAETRASVDRILRKHFDPVPPPPESLPFQSEPDPHPPLRHPKHARPEQRRKGGSALRGAPPERGDGQESLCGSPSAAASSFADAAEFFTMPGLAPGLVIKHINGENTGENTLLPRNPKEWKGSDKKGFLESSPLSDLGKSRTRAIVKVFESDVKVCQKTTNTQANGRWIGGQRQNITELTRRSCLNLVHTARNVTGLVAMVTLTYPAEFPCDGKKVKKHLELMRKWMLYRGIGAFWFLEFQRRGAPHFHLFTNAQVDKEDLSRAWFKIVDSGDEKHLLAGTKVEAIRKPHAIATYAAKYAAKAEQKTVPEGYEDVGRFWGNFGGVKVKPIDEETGTLKQVAPLIRVIRKLDKVNRRQLGLRPKTRKGKVGFTSYGTSEAVRKYLQWQVPF